MYFVRRVVYTSLQMNCLHLCDIMKVLQSYGLCVLNYKRNHALNSHKIYQSRDTNTVTAEMLLFCGTDVSQSSTLWYNLLDIAVLNPYKEW